MKINDKSPRTRAVSVPMALFIASTLSLGVSVAGYVAGSVKYVDVAASSSSPVGSELKFVRSDASLELKGIYTDEDRSVMIARLGTDSIDRAKIPARGSDYKVFIESDAYGSESREIDVLFGRLSTDGDMFLVIPRPTDDVYSVFIMNTQYLSSSSSARPDASQDGPVDISSAQTSITEALSSYSYNPERAAQPYTIKSDNMDIVSFRLTLDPAFDGPEYKPIVLDTPLLSEDGEFDYRAMFDKLFKESAYDDLTQQHSLLSEQEISLNKTRGEYVQRLSRNPDDSSASTALSTVDNELSQISERKTELAAQMNAYEALTFDPDMFSDVQGKAQVVTVKK